MLTFNKPASVAEALQIIRAMEAGELVTNFGGDAHNPAAVMAMIGDNFFFYTKAYCIDAQQVDGLWQGKDFTGAALWLEDMATGVLTPINKMSVGAEQLMKAINS
jgi:hypothetical protein